MKRDRAARNASAGLPAPPRPPSRSDDFMASLKHLQDEKPEQFKQVVSGLAQAVRDQAKSATGHEQRVLDRLADRLDKVADSGNLSALQPGREGAAGHARGAKAYPPAPSSGGGDGDDGAHGRGRECRYAIARKTRGAAQQAHQGSHRGDQRSQPAPASTSQHPSRRVNGIREQPAGRASAVGLTPCRSCTRPFFQRFITGARQSCSFRRSTKTAA